MRRGEGPSNGELNSETSCVTGTLSVSVEPFLLQLCGADVERCDQSNRSEQRARQANKAFSL
jgi:hypothetical protein